ncbi:hypothetical protein E1B28_013013 [Marasmius oreades]|uniref:Uncharacterized protein n=1 Tax=Marasmius oreades TaxID=181124 RepID=A0A9P7UPG5_9AGAR|nr:uncharacterized protein E1B28_013013 [Marasmius oreades]KAG7087034.1 hypothetical protein E1B28_013013 [Marasmius oreades]
MLIESIKIKIPAQQKPPLINISSSPPAGPAPKSPDIFSAEFTPKKPSSIITKPSVLWSDHEADYNISPIAFHTPTRQSSNNSPAICVSSLPPLPKFHKRIRTLIKNLPSPNRDGPVEITSGDEALSLSGSDDSLITSPRKIQVPMKRLHGRPRKEQPQPSESFCVKLYVEVLGEMKMEQTKSKRGAPKMVMEESQLFGPQNLTNMDTYEDFLEACADMVHSDPKNLAIASMSWSFTKDGKSVRSKGQKTGAGLPIMDNVGLSSMIDDIRALVDDKKAVCKVMITMGCPLRPGNSLPVCSLL